MSWIKDLLKNTERKKSPTTKQEIIENLRGKFEISDSLAKILIQEENPQPKNDISTSKTCDVNPILEKMMEEEKKRIDKIREIEEKRKVEREKYMIRLRKIEDEMKLDLDYIMDCLYEITDKSQRSGIKKHRLGSYLIEILVDNRNFPVNGTEIELTDSSSEILRSIRPTILRIKSRIPDIRIFISTQPPHRGYNNPTSYINIRVEFEMSKYNLNPPTPF